MNDHHQPAAGAWALRPALTEWVSWRQVSREVAAHTVNANRVHINRFTDWADTHLPGARIPDVTTAHARAYITHLDRQVKPQSWYQYILTLRTAWRFFVAEETAVRNPWDGIRQPKIPDRPPRRVPTERAHRIVDAATPRTRVMILLGLHLGLRVSEIAGLQVDHYDPHHRVLTIHRAKGGKTRVVPVAGQAREALEGWIGDRTTGPMWPTTNPDRAGEGLSTRHVGRLITDASKGTDRTTAHQYRHTFASEAIARGVSVETARRILGHSTLATLDRYVALFVDELRADLGDGPTYGAR